MQTQSKKNLSPNSIGANDKLLYLLIALINAMW